jgi:sulfate adenylyltransferase
MASSKTSCAAKDQKFFLSGTQVRQMLDDGVDIPVEFTRPEVARILQDAARAKHSA